MRIYVICDNQERYHFFSVLLGAYKCNVLFLASSPALYRKIKRGGWSVRLLKSKIDKPNLVGRDFSEVSNLVAKSFEVLSNKISRSRGAEAFVAYLVQCNEIMSKSQGYVLMWNGSRLMERAVSKCIAEQHAAGHSFLKTAYLEIANIPGKLFVDPCGVNAESFYYSMFNLQLKNDHEKLAEKSQFLEWKQDYISSKRKQAGVAQTKFSRKIYLSPVFDQISALFTAYGLRTRVTNLVAAMVGRVLSERYIRKVSDRDVVPKSYVFVPLQVSGDTQIKINGSGWDNHSLVRHAASRADELGVSLLVKIHPSENNLLELIKVCRTIDQFEGQITSENTFLLLEGAHLVVTINSTVGLEAAIAKANCEVLGKALFSNFSNDNDLRHYIDHWLVNIDYFNPQAVGSEFFEEIDNRYEIYRRLPAG